MRRTICALVLGLVAVAAAADTVAAPSPTLIQLIDPLDEPQFYCVDVPGFGRGIDLDGALIAHTCKPSADDELFAVDHRSAGQLSMPAYDRCVEAAGAAVSAELYLRECSDEPRQRFALSADGRIRLMAADTKRGKGSHVTLALIRRSQDHRKGPSE